jgi:SAM-dependent methyltransferase
VTERWGHYIRRSIEKEGGIFQAALQSWRYAAPLAEAIRRAVPPPARILKVGCGTAFLSIYLHPLGYRATAIDEDPEVSEIGREIVAFFRAKPMLVLGTAADLAPDHRQFDLTFSEGVAEHFPRGTTVELLHEQSGCSPWVFVSIPTRHTLWIQGVTDDAHSYSLRGLKKVVQEAGLCGMDSGALCEVQSSLPIWLSQLFPLPLYCWTQCAFTLPVSVYYLGQISGECG